MLLRNATGLMDNETGAEADAIALPGMGKMTSLLCFQFKKTCSKRHSAEAF